MWDSRRLKRRLRELRASAGRDPRPGAGWELAVPTAPAPSPLAELVRRRRLGRRVPGDRPTWGETASPPIPPGGEPDETPLDRRDGLWVREERLDLERAGGDLFGPGFSLLPYVRRVAPSGAELPEREQLIFFDLETTGLAARDMLFLAGYLYWERSELVLVQEVASDVAEERALVSRAAERLAHRRALVVFNGKSFDLPALERRLFFHGLDRLERDALTIYDLLHLARRRYRSRLPDCRLSTLERRVIRKERNGRDVSGAEVPDRFADFRETGELRHLEPVLYHNRIDLTTLVVLLLQLIEPVSEEDERTGGRSTHGDRPRLTV